LTYTFCFSNCIPERLKKIIKREYEIASLDNNLGFLAMTKPQQQQVSPVRNSKDIFVKLQWDLY